MYVYCLLIYSLVLQTAVVLLLLEMDRKYKEEETKKAKSAAETDRINGLHAQHTIAETELRLQQREINEVLGRLDERLMMIEEQILDRNKSKKRFGIF